MAKPKTQQQTIPAEAIGIFKPQGFFKAFFNALPHYDTYVEAYEHVEQLHEKYYGCRHYTSYNSFQTARKKIKK